jgi:predicted amidohydrolase YtcJ
MRWLFPALLLAVASCAHKQEHADLVVHNAQIYLVDDDFRAVKAMAITDGKVVEIGAEREILNKYRADEFVDAAGRCVLPMFSDTAADPASLLAETMLGARGFPMDAREAVLTLTILRARDRYEEDIRGSLGKGKEASFIIFNGDPLSGTDVSDVTTGAIYIKGKQVFP